MSKLLPAALVLFSAVLAGAQQPEAQTDTQGIFTMKVYANLVQVPTLILDDNKRPVPGLTRDKIGVSIDEGPLFPPTRMHVEGDEPLSLSILLDLSGNQHQLVSNFGDAFAKLVPKYLHASDHITLYALDCNLIRTLHDVPADSTQLASAFARTLALDNLHNPAVHGRTDKPACANTVRLWDSVAQMSLDLQTSRSRRVILVVSEGRDGKSVLDFDKASYMVSAKGVALFGLRERLEYETKRNMDAAFGPYHSDRQHTEDLLATLSGQNGGRVLNITTDQLATTLQDFIATLRGRYIIEFPRPDEINAGQHGIAVTVPGKDVYIRAAGASVSLPDPSLRDDPLTIPSGASPAVIGKKRPTPAKN